MGPWGLLFAFLDNLVIWAHVKINSRMKTLTRNSQKASSFKKEKEREEEGKKSRGKVVRRAGGTRDFCCL